MSLATKMKGIFSLIPFWIKAGANGESVTPESAVDLVLNCHGVAPIQVRSELLEFASIARTLKPKALLEIGTRKGGTFFVLCRMADPEAQVISLDLPGGRFGGGYRIFQVPVLRRMKKSGQKMHLIRMDSHTGAAKEQVEKALQGKTLDLLFIDGDHTYAGVKQDFEMYSPLVAPGGIIVFHDILPTTAPGIEVAQFWEEIKIRYRHREIIEDRNQGRAGIGVLYL